MLDAFRKHSKSTVIYLAFGAIIIIFAFGFGAGGSVCSPNTPGTNTMNEKLVEVDGEWIDQQLLMSASELSIDAPAPGQRSNNELFYRITRFQSLQLDGPYSGAYINGFPAGYAYGRAMQDVSPIKEMKVLDELIETRLVSSYAKKLGMSVTNEELNERLARFQAQFRDEKTGEFLRKNYNFFLSKSLQMTSAGFERFVKDEILRERVIALLVGEVSVTDAEAQAEHDLKNDKVKVEVITVDKSSAQALVPVTDAEVQTWLAANEQKVKDEYEKKKALEFTTPKTFTLRVIKLDAPSAEAAGDDAEKQNIADERKTIKAKADAALADIKAKIAAPPAPAPEVAPNPENPDAPAPAPAPAATPFSIFAEVAKTVSDDASKDNDAKWEAPVPANKLARSPFGPAIAAAAPSLVVGQPSDVIETTDGFWILMPEAIAEEVVKTLDEAKPLIAKSALQAERVDAFKKSLADEVRAEAAKDPKAKLEVAAKAINAKYGAPEGKGLQAQELAAFSRLEPARYISGLGKAPEMGLAAFAASAESPLLPQVYTAMGDVLVVARFLEKPAPTPMTDDEKKQLRESMTTQRRAELYRGWYDDLLAKSKLSGDYEESDELGKLRTSLQDSFVAAGGLLPGMKPKTPQGLQIDGLPPGVQIIQGGQ